MHKKRSTRQMQLLQYEMLLELDKVCKKYNIKYSLAYGTLLGAVRHQGYIPWDNDTDVTVSIEDYESLCEKLKIELKDDFDIYFIEDYKDDGPLLARIGMKNESTKWMHLDIFPMVGAPSNKLKQKTFVYKALLNKKLYFFKKVNINNNYKDSFIKKIIALFIKIVASPLSSKCLFNYDKKLRVKYKINDSRYLYNIYGSYGMKEFIPKEYFFEQTKLKFENSEFPVPKEWHAYLTQMYGDYKVPKK